MNTPGRILIVGGLAAGPAAAAKAKRLNPKLEITLFEQGEHISYATCSMPYYIGDTIKSSDELIAFSPENFEKEKGCEVKTLHRVEELMPHRKKIVVLDLKEGKRKEYKYDRLLLATGAKIVVFNPAWLEARNVFVVKTLADSIRLKQYIDTHHPQQAVIVGGGFIGMEMADALRSRNMNVIIMHSGPEPMNSLEPESRRIVLDELQRNEVRFFGEQRLKEILVHDGMATHVVTTSEKRTCDLVILATGFSPNADLARAAHIRCGKLNGIVVDDYLKTGADHVYAAGACCELTNLVSGKPMVSPLATVSNKMGWAAGSNLAGHPTVYQGSVRTSVVKVFDLEVASVGLSEREAQLEGFRVLTESVIGQSKGRHYPGRKSIFVKLIVDRSSKHLLGANLIAEEGAAQRINVLSTAIAANMTIADIAQLDLMYTPPFSPLWDPLLIAANKTLKRL